MMKPVRFSVPSTQSLSKGVTMPRNGSGTYSLPAGNPVVAGTTIEASWANTTLNDVATEMTGSLARSGSGGMTGPLRLDAGTAGVPALAWSTETTTGLYRAGTNDVRLAVATSDVMRWQAAGVSVTGTLGVSAAATFSTTLAVTGAATLSSTLAVTGTTTLTGAATLTANPTLSAGTANGVLYLNGSQVASSGSALTFDGTYFTANGLRLAGTDVTNTIYQATGALGISTGTASGITFATNLTTRMTLDGSGNLGIGVASPTQKLELSGDIQQQNANYLRGRLAAGTSTRLFGLAGTNVLYIGGIDASQDSTLFVRGGATQMNLDASGNLGIGTTSPGSKLDVYGGASGTNTNAQVGNASTAFLFGVDASNNCQVRTAQNVAMLFYTNATQRMQISADGNVLVGTAALATTATAGFPWIPSCPGVPTGAPTAPYTNAAAMVVDTTNNRLYVRVGSTWRYATLT
jgi:hypothetical protein